MPGIQAVVQFQGVSQPDIHAAGQTDPGSDSHMEYKAAQAQKQDRDIFLRLGFAGRGDGRTRLPAAFPQSPQVERKRGSIQYAAEN